MSHDAKTLLSSSNGLSAGPCTPGPTALFREQALFMSDPKEPAEDEEAHSRRVFANLLAVIVCLVILIAGFWLMNKLWEAKKLQDCVFAGRRDCGPPIEVSP